MTFRVMTYNIRHARGIDGIVDIDRIGRVIIDSHADIACLQEVDCRTARTGNIDMMARLAEQTGMHSFFGRNIDFQGGGYGNGILSRFPFLEVRNRHYRMIRKGEQRGAIDALIDLGGVPVAVINTHVDYRPDDRERLMNIGEIKEIADSRAGIPTIVCGDFNDVPESRTISAMADRFIDLWSLIGRGDGNTFPANSPNRRIDYIFLARDETAAKDSISPVSITTIDTQASDHLPLMAEFRLNQSCPGNRGE